MKKLFFFAALLLTAFTITAQNRFAKAAEEASAAADSAPEVIAFKQKLYADLDQLRESQQAILQPAKEETILTNAKELPHLLDEFVDAARYYHVDYTGKLARLQKVMVVDAPLTFMGAVTEGGRVIMINSELLNYPELFRIIFFNQMGSLYGLRHDREGHTYMSNQWDIDAQNEAIAEFLSQRPHEKRRFFERLAKKHPLKKQF